MNTKELQKDISVVLVFNDVKILRLLTYLAKYYNLKVSTLNYGAQFQNIFYSKNWIELCNFFFLLWEVQRRGRAKNYSYLNIGRTQNLRSWRFFNEEQKRLPTKLGSRFKKRKLLNKKQLFKNLFPTIVTAAVNYSFVFKAIIQKNNFLNYAFFERNFLRPSKNFVFLPVLFTLIFRIVWIKIFVLINNFLGLIFIQRKFA